MNALLINSADALDFKDRSHLHVLNVEGRKKPSALVSALTSFLDGPNVRYALPRIRR